MLIISGTTTSSPLLDLFNITLPEEFINKTKSSLEDYVYTDKQTKLAILINAYHEHLDSNFSDYIASGEFNEFIRKATEIYDYIIVDGPCMKRSADAEALAKVCDFSLLVVKQNCTKTPLINDTIDTLNKYNKGLAGFIFNDVHSSATVINIGYGYGYGRKIDYGYGSYGKYGRYGSYGSYGKYKKYGKYGSYGNYGNYSRYGAYYHHGRYEAKRDKK